MPTAKIVSRSGAGLGSAASLALAIVVAGCSGGGSGTPTAPTAPAAPAVSLQSIRATPNGAGVLHGTNFQFDASGTFPTGTQFVWQFGDGSTATTTESSARHVYSQSGSFAVSLEARLGASSGAAVTQVSVRSMVGRWRGTVTGHTRYPPSRPVAIRSFDLTISVSPTPAASCVIGSNAAWSDDAGCRRNVFCQSFPSTAAAEISFSIETLSCNDGDFIFRGTADAAFDRVEGACTSGGPNCRFTMTRQ